MSELIERLRGPMMRGCDTRAEALLEARMHMNSAADALEAQAKRIAELENYRKTNNEDWHIALADMAGKDKHIAELEARLAQVEGDAGRYRWLRKARRSNRRSHKGTSMNLREQFERLHPVPELTIFGDICYVSQSSSEHMQQMTEDYNGLYQGFRSGHAAGMERAAGICDAAEEAWNVPAPGSSDDREYLMGIERGFSKSAAAIRAAKEQK